MCGGGGPPPPPPPSATEEELRRLQIDQLKETQRLTGILQPLQASEMGLRPIYGDDPVAVDLQRRIDEAAARAGGNRDSPEAMALRVEYTKRGFDDPANYKNRAIVGYEKTPERLAQDKQVQELQAMQLETARKSSKALDDYLKQFETPEYKAAQEQQKAIEAQQREIALKQGERQKLALEGKLPLSQGTIDRKAQEFTLLKEAMARAGNPIIGDDPDSAYSLTSPGAQALDTFARRYKLVEDSERRGELDSGSQLYLQSVGLGSDLGRRDLGMATGLSQPGGFAGTSAALRPGDYSFANAGLNLAGAYGSAMAPYMQDRQLAFQSGMAGYEGKMQERAGLMSLAGTALGSGAALMALSSKKAKKNIKKVGKKGETKALDLIKKGDIYEYDYKDEPDGEGRGRHLGVMSEEAAPELVASDGKHLNVVNYLGTITGAIRELDRKIEGLSLRGNA